MLTSENSPSTHSGEEAMPRAQNGVLCKTPSRSVGWVGLAASRVSLDRWSFAARLARPWKGRTAPEGAAHFPAQPYRRDGCAN
jgi:hypothetical protein